MKKGRLSKSSLKRFQSWGIAWNGLCTPRALPSGADSAGFGVPQSRKRVYLAGSIDTSTIFSGALIPELVKQRPDSIPYLIEWPIELDLVNDDCVIVIRNNVEYNIYELELQLTNNSAEGPIEFSVGNESFAVNYQLVFIDGKAVVELVSPLDLAIKKRQTIATFM